MSPTPDDDARPIPQRLPARPSGGQPRQAPDDVYTVDTRGRARRPAPQGTGRPAPARPRTQRPEQAPLTAQAGRPDSTRAMPRGERPARDASVAPARAAPARAVPTRIRPHRRGRLVVLLVLLLVAAWVAWMVWVPLHAWGAVSRIDASPAGSRPTGSKGHNYLLVGSDSRQGLTAAQKKEYATGSDAGQRTDSIILVHVPSSGGKPSMISVPRDSYVPIPGHGSNKINAAYAFGGPKLLVQTVEQVTDLHIDGLMEIGFAGFAGVVDSLDGVNICVPFDMFDKLAGINLKKGCQVLNGKNALGFVRSRHSDPRGDIGRAQRQRQFLAAIMNKAATPSTVLVPTRYYHFSMAAASGLRVDRDMSLSDAVKVLQTMRGAAKGDTLSFTVPIATINYQTNAGSSIKWDTPRARALFNDLRNDTPLTAAPAGTDGKPSTGT